MTTGGKARFAAGAALAVGAALIAPAVSQAADYTVTNTNASGSGSLADAVSHVNSGAANRILFASGVSGSIDLSGELTIKRAVEIDGPGAGTLAIKGDGTDRIFLLNMSTSHDPVTISALTLENGGYTGGGNGGAIDNLNSNLMVSSSVLSSNGGAAGGAIFSNDALTVEDSTLSGNAAQTNGGAIEADAGASIVRSTISGNGAASGGGALLKAATVGATTISGNHATGNGGGLTLDSDTTHGPSSLTNTTISGNSSGGEGGGVYAYSASPGAPGTFDSVTVANNTASSGAGGIHASAASATAAPTLDNTIAADNAPADLDVSGASQPFATAFSLIQNAPSDAFSGAPSDVIGQDPKLGPLASNGGPTQTQALDPSSPAVDRGATTLTVDQRGQPRPDPEDGAVGPDDIGAFELQSALPLPTENPPPPRARLKLKGPVRVRGNTISVRFHCGAAKCQGVFRGTSVEVIRSGRLVKVAGKRAKVTVGAVGFNVPQGRTVTVRFQLDVIGRALLRRFGRLPVNLTLSLYTGGTPIKRHVVVRHRRR